MRISLLILAALLLAGCGIGNVKPDLPKGAVTPTLEVVERHVYVPVPDELTEQEPIAEGPIAACFSVAADRRAALTRANSKLKRIGEIEGTEVKP